eukprot:GHVT01082920.1.p1 GENE.GHVT01082920.1~~GHVT01082920.1.p1  ORF type:complete len:101 (+),score=13.71 GHVT01082920.1:887-1189(+)
MDPSAATNAGCMSTMDALGCKVPIDDKALARPLATPQDYIIRTQEEEEKETAQAETNSQMRDLLKQYKLDGKVAAGIPKPSTLSDDVSAGKDQKVSAQGI